MGYDLFRRDNVGDIRSYDDALYFRANVHGMALLRRRLALANALDETSPRPDDVLDAPGRDGKLPLYKLQSNDGWILSPDECRLAAAALTSSTPPASDGEHESLAFIRRFAAFLAGCAEHGGCEVH